MKKINRYLVSIIVLIVITLPKITYATSPEGIDFSYKENFKVALFGIPGTYDGNTIYKDPSAANTSSSSGQTIDNMIDSANDFTTEEDDSTLTVQNNELQDLSSLIFNVLLNLATALSVLVGLYIGIQFMIGSVEQKAKVKELLVPYVVGCIVVYGALGIWKLVVTILQNSL